MKPRPLLSRVCRNRLLISSLLLGVAILTLWYCRQLLHSWWTLLSLPFVWSRGSSDFLISPISDGFDLTFANYSRSQTSAGPTYDDRVPPVLHHIALGTRVMRPTWEEAVQNCLDWHPGWEAHFWTDENARTFVAERFPELLAMWDEYPYPVQRVDALRYMVLYEFGGVVLDMDLKCKRSLGPLRRFDFVAPAAHPTGFSIGFMMASKQNDYVGQIVQSLGVYNRRWLGLPYPTVMFSTGCHFASTIHASAKNRAELKILAGPGDQPKLHMLNGRVSTPLFDHLGSSSWHSYDASLIVVVGKTLKYRRSVWFVVGVVCALWFVRRFKSKGVPIWRKGKRFPLDVEDRV